MDSTHDRRLGCILGGAIGDAAGAASEGAAPGNGANWRESEWFLTDDTQLTLATCEALRSGVVDPVVIAEHMVRWFRAGRVHRMGASTLKALRDLAAGAHWALAGRTGERAAGNGAAMRIAPLAFHVDPTTSSGRSMIRDVARITHHHEEAYIGALAVVLALHLEGASLRTVAGHLPDSVVRDRLLSLDGVPNLAEAARRAGTSGYVADSVPLALYAGRQMLDSGFSETLGEIINLGGDVDTVASIAGQIAGARLGRSGLPAELLERLPEPGLVRSLAEDWAKQAARER